MRKTFIFLLLVLVNLFRANTQEVNSKVRAEIIAKENFSKSKHKKKEKYGITKEVNRVIVSSPVIKQNISEYSGVYQVHDLNYYIELKIKDKVNIEATWKEPDNTSSGFKIFYLKNISIRNALFTATKVSPEGVQELLEGVFINKNDNGIVDFGLGIKLPKSITLNGLTMDKLFFKKVKQN